MAKLTAADRKRIPQEDFALPGGHYPIEDANHARNALARAAQFASPAEQATVRRKVAAKYPDIAVSGQHMPERAESHKAMKKNKHGSA